MNAYQLAKFHGESIEPVNIWACGICNTTDDQERAELCCKCHECGKQCDRKYGIMHPACREASYAERDRKALAQATVVEKYTGPVFTQSDRFFQTATEAAEHYDGEANAPEFAFCCHVKPVLTDEMLIDALENALSDEPEECQESIRWPDSLMAAWAETVEQHKSVNSWWPDKSQKVRLKYDDPTWTREEEKLSL